jgi:dimethylpropiothetin dethiomethylase
MTDLAPAPDAVPEPRLADTPDWRYLLREFYELYRHLPSGGSDRIRSHQRAVREAINRVMRANPSICPQDPSQLPVTAHLKRALDEGRMDRMSPSIRALESVAPELSWQYGYEKLSKGLARAYGYAELAGPNGPVRTTELILGIVLLAPGCTYPAHAHSGITESYICLSGAVSENHQGVYAPGSMIFSPPEHLHRITVGKDEPALLAYAWMGSAAHLKEQEMVFNRKRR